MVKNVLLMPMPNPSTRISGRRKGAILQEQSRRKSDIVRHLLNERNASAVSDAFSCLLKPTEGDQGLTPRFVGRHTGANVVSHAHREMAVKLGRTLAVDLCLSKHVHEPDQPRAKESHERPSLFVRNGAKIAVVLSHSRASCPHIRFARCERLWVTHIKQVVWQSNRKRRD
jgi:hypothetical protein